MQTFYVLKGDTDYRAAPPTYNERAQSLTAGLIIGDPSGLVTLYPSVVVISPSLATVVIPDDTGQATLAQVQTAQTNATNAETAAANNIINAKSSIQAALSNLPTIKSQAQTDLATLSTSTSPNAPILTRIINDSLTMAQALENLLVALEIIS